MDLSNDLISKFVKITNDDKNKNSESTVYGTVVEYNGGMYVRIDGSDLLTPVETTADFKPNERVTVMIKNHSATVTGNITSPATNEGAVTEKVTEAVEEVEGKVITEVEILIADRVSTKQLDAEVARIDELIAGKASVEDLTATNAEITNLKADKASVEDLTATNAEITNLKAEDAKIENLLAGKATVEDLTATNAEITNLKAKDAEIENLVADKARIEDLTATNARIDSLQANKADITYLDANFATIDELEAAHADIEILDAEVANINTLVNGNLTSDNILSLNITSQNTTMENAFVKDAMIDTVTANKIMSGTIDTNNVTIQSTDGSMLLQGTLLQMKDDNGKVRIQIGKDTGGNFTFILYDESGTGVLIDEEGIKSSDAIADGLIVDAKVADNANIAGSKLDIASVITEVNNDNSTTIKSNKIYLDEQGQSLEVAFNSLKTQVETIQDVTIDGDLTAVIEQVQSNTTQIAANKEGISTLVSENTIRKEEIQNLDGEIESVNNTLSSKYSSLEQDVSGFKTTVADTYTTKSEFNNLEVGGRNLLENSSFKKDINKWNIWNPNNSTPHSFVTNDGKQCCKIDMPALENAYVFSQSILTDLVYGETYTVSGWLKTENIQPGTTNFTLMFYIDGWYDNNGVDTWYGLCRQEFPINKGAGSWQHISGTFTVNNPAFRTARLCDFFVYARDFIGQVYFYDVKLEKGNKATDWTPSPEDVQGQIDATNANLQNNYSTTSQMNSAINQKANEITSSVSETYATKQSVTDVSNNLATNYSTTSAMNSAIQQKANEITSSVSETYTTKSEFNNLQIGGTNLLPKSGDFKDNCGLWISNGSTMTLETVVTYNGHNSIKIDNNSSEGIIYNECITLKPNTTYTYSITAMAAGIVNAGINTPLHMWVYPPGNPGNYHHEEILDWSHTGIGTKWGRSYIVFKTPDTNDFCLMKPFIYQTEGQVIYVANFKVEEGNRPTDWSPAPEDVQGQIDATNNNLTNNYSTTSQMNSAIQQKANEITSTVSQTYTTKSEFNNLQIGGKNLLLNSKRETTNNGYCIDQFSPTELFEVGEQYTVSICVTPANGVTNITPFVSGGWTGLSGPLYVNGETKQVSSTTFTFYGYESSRVPVDITDSNAFVQFYRFPNDGTVTGNTTLHWAKVEKGAKATDWSPAPEDVQGQIDATNNNLANNYSTTSQMNSAIQQKANEITSSVSETYTTKSEFNNLQIGGTNTFKISKVGSETWDINYNPSFTVNSENGFNVITADGRTHTRLFHTIKDNGYWTVSFKVKSSVYVGPIHIDICDKDAGDFTSDTNWSEVTRTVLVDNYSVDPFNFVDIEQHIDCGQAITYYFKDVKVEKGNRPTAWSPAPEDVQGQIDATNNNLSANYSTTSQMNSAIQQKANEITSTVSQTYTTKSEFNSLNIGSTNLVAGTKDFSGWGYYNLYMNKINETAIDSRFTGMSVSFTLSASDEHCDLAKYEAVWVEPDTEYTLSFWARGSGQFYTYLYTHDGGPVASHYNSSGYSGTQVDGASIHTLSSNDTYKRYWVVYRTSSTAKGIVNLIATRAAKNLNTDVNMVIYGVKFEKGNRPTDWSPAPEDVQGQIDATNNNLANNYSTTSQMNSAIQQKANEITSTVSQTYISNYEAKKLADTTTTGLNKYLFERYQRDGFDYGTRPTLNDLVGARLIESQLVDNPPPHTSDLGSNYIGVLTFYLYYDHACTKTIQIATDDNGTVYLNNVVIYELNTCQGANVTFNMIKGLNRIDIIYAEGGGGDGVSWGGTDGWSAFGAYANVVTNEIANRTNELTLAMTQGNMLYTDPTFRNGHNGTFIYNNQGNGTVTNERIAAIEGCPNTSGYCLKITTNGEAIPGLGGFAFGNNCRYNAVFITKITAKIPVGYSITWASNAVGDNGEQKWLSSTAGTGDWYDYYCKVKCGDHGSIVNTNYFYLVGPQASAENPVTWYVSYATVFDVTDSDERITNLTNNLAVNYSTTSQMNSAIQQKANEITSSVSETYTTKSEFNNLQIGGTNLIQNGKFKGAIAGSTSMPDPWAFWSDEIHIFGSHGLPGYNHDGCVYIGCNLTDGRQAGMFSNDIHVSKVEKGANYMASFIFAIENNVKGATAQLEYLNDARNQILHTQILTTARVSTNIGNGLNEHQYHIPFTMWTGDFSYIRIVFNHGGTNAVSAGYLMIVGNVQIEKGNKATDWSPAPEDVQGQIDATNNNLTNNYSTTSQMNSAIQQKANEITSSVSQTYTTKSETTAIQNQIVTSRNLLMGSRDYNLGKWSPEGANILDEWYNGTRIYTTTIAWASMDYWVSDLIDRGVIELFTPYTFSCYVMSTGSDYTPDIRFYGDGLPGFSNASCGTATTSWQRISITLEWSSFDNRSYSIRFEATTPSPSGSHLKWACFQLERGRVATGWAPAPEDAQYAINDVNNNLVANYATTSSMNSAIQQKANEITSSVSQTYATKQSVTDVNNNLANNYSTTTQMNSAIQQKANEITSSVSQTYITKSETSLINDTVAGNRKWLFEMYTNNQQVGTGGGTYPTLAHLANETLISSRLVDSLPGYTSAIGDSYIGVYTVYLYYESAYTWSGYIISDDESTTYLNGVAVCQAASCTQTTFTMNFKKGINKLQIIHGEGGGGDGVTLSDLGPWKEYGAYPACVTAASSNHYASNSDIVQTANDLTIKFTESGGYNLLQNGHANKGTNYWLDNGGGITTHANAGGGATGNFFGTSFPHGIAYYDWVKLLPNTHYVYQAKIWSNATFDGHSGVPLHYWFSYDTVNNTGDGYTILDYQQNVSYTGTWTQCYLHFVTGNNDIYIKPYIWNGGVTTSIFVTELMLSQSRVVQPWSPHPSEVYSGITQVDKDGIRVHHSNANSYTHMAPDGFFVNNNGTDVVQVTASGLYVQGNITSGSTIQGARITGSTFNSSNDVFQVLEDGTIETSFLAVNGAVSTDKLNVNDIENASYPKVLSEATTVYISPNGGVNAEEFYDGAYFTSLSNMLAVAPRNLNGYTLTIRMAGDLYENAALTWFHSGQVNFEMQGYTLYGYFYGYGASMCYRLYGNTNANNSGAWGHIKPNTGRALGSYSYAVQFQYCQFAINNIAVYPSASSGSSSGGISAHRGATGIVFSAKACGDMRYLVRAEYAGRVHVNSSEGACNNATFCASTGGIITLNSSNSQAGRSTSGNPYWVGTGGAILCDQLLGMDKIKFNNTTQSGSSSSSGSSTRKVTETVKATSADTYRSTVYNNWKGDGTVRQGDYGYGDCQGCWFFGNNLYNTMNAGTVTKVVIRIQRQSGGVNALQTLTVKSHNHTSRPSGAPTYTNTIGTCSCAVGSYIDLVITDQTTINKLKNCKGLGLSIGSASSPYAVCSGACSVIITYTTNN